MISIKDKWRALPLTVKATSAYALCSIIQKCLSFITMPLFTRLLTEEQYGQVTIYQSWMGIISIFITLNLAYGSFSTAMVRFGHDRDGYISTLEGIFATFSLVFLIIYLPFRNLWNQLFELPTYIICIMVAEILTTNALLIWTARQRFEFKYKTVVAITLVTLLMSPLIQYLLVITNDEKGYARIIGAAVINIISGGFFFFYNACKGKKILHREYWKYALSFNIPLLAYYLSQVIFNTSDRIMISHMIGTDKAGIYGVAYSLAMVLTFVLNAINNSYVPWFYGIIKEDKVKDNRSISLMIAGLMALLLLLVIWFAPEIIVVMAGSKYSEAVYVIPPVAISLLLLLYSQLFINVEFYYEQKSKLIGASIGAALINIVLNWLFIRRFGFIAAAYTTLASYIVFTFANYRAMKKILDEKGIIDEGFNYVGLISLFICFSIVSYVGVALYKCFVPRLAVPVLIAIFAIINRKRLVQLVNTIKTR